MVVQYITCFKMVINGKDNQDYLLPFLAKSSIPLHARSSGVIEFLNKLDEIKIQDEQMT